MTQQLKFAFAVAVFAAAQGLAQEGPDRMTAEAKWAEGSLMINYAAPAWKDEFKDHMNEVWRFGKNLPTTAVLTCGLESSKGAIPPGNYTLALKPAGDKWNLLVYEASVFYDPAFKTWEIAPSGPTKKLDTPAPALKIRFEDKTMIADFGPMSVSWALKPIKVNPPIETEFGRFESKFEVLALPLAGTTFKDTLVGVATTTRGETMVRYHMKLTVEGENATLTLSNERAAAIAKERETVENITERIAAMIEKNPDNEQMNAALTTFKSQLESLTSLSTAFERLETKQEIKGTVTTGGEARTTLGLSHDRPTGAIVLKLGLANGEAAFEIKPREQFTKRRGE